MKITKTILAFYPFMWYVVVDVVVLFALQLSYTWVMLLGIFCWRNKRQTHRTLHRTVNNSDYWQLRQLHFSSSSVCVWHMVWRTLHHKNLHATSVSQAHTHHCTKRAPIPMRKTAQKQRVHRAKGSLWTKQKQHRTKASKKQLI